MRGAASASSRGIGRHSCHVKLLNDDGSLELFKNVAKPNVDADAKQQERGCPHGACTAQRLRAEELVATRELSLAEDEAEFGCQKITRESNVTEVSKVQDVKCKEQESVNL